jgi:hypothetical protein
MENSIYSVDKNLEVKTNSRSFITTGIHENIRLVNVAYGTTPRGVEFLSFYFEDERGDTLSQTEFPVSLRKPLDSMSEQEKEMYLGSIDTQKRRVGQIVTTFVSKEKYSFVANTFKEFAENIIRILNDRDKSILARVKVVYNKKNYTTLPSYWKFPFIEPMTVSKEDSKIRILNIDNMVKKEADLESIPEAVDPYVDPPKSEAIDPNVDLPKSADDLPF